MIGRKLAVRLAEAGWDVCNLYYGGEKPTEKLNLYSVEMDFARGLKTGTMPNRIDAVIHLAESESIRDFPESAPHMFAVNTASTALLLDYAKDAGAKTFILGSNGGVYPPDDGDLHESLPVLIDRMDGYYYATKACSEMLARAYVDIMNIVTLRFFFVYGLAQRETAFIPRLIKQVASGETLELTGEEGMYFNPVHVLDAVEAIVASLNLTRSACINIAGPEVITLRDACKIIGEKAKKEPVFNCLDMPPARIVADIVRMRDLLVEPVHLFDNNIEEMVGHIMLPVGTVP